MKKYSLIDDENLNKFDIMSEELMSIIEIIEDIMKIDYEDNNEYEQLNEIYFKNKIFLMMEKNWKSMYNVLNVMKMKLYKKQIFL